MTEAEWLRAQNPGLMLDFVRKRVESPRRLRLAAVGCCRLAWPHVPPLPHPRDAECLALLDLAERYADGSAKFTELTAARRALAGADVPRGGPTDSKVAAVWFASARDPASGCTETAFRLLGVSWGGANELDMPEDRVRFGFHRGGDWVAACRAMLAAVRDVFGNPFRKVPFDPNWRTTAAVGVARQMYESRDFAPMPILADALQDAGCEGEDVLTHCRGDGPHVRGCWVVDLLLGKE